MTFACKTVSPWAAQFILGCLDDYPATASMKASMIVHYDNAIMTIKVCTLAASSARYYDIELSVLLNLTYFVLSSLAQVRYLSLIAISRSKEQKLMEYPPNHLNPKSQHPPGARRVIRNQSRC